MRSSGILLHISSLPSRGGIGTFGKEAFRFVDFLKDSGQRLWQLLPLCPTNVGDSPYQSFSTFAGNPYFIDPELLEEHGLITQAELLELCPEGPESSVDYRFLYDHRYRLLRTAHSRFTEDAAYYDFCRRESCWLDDYALFMSLKDFFGGAPWSDWPEALRFRENSAVLAAVEAFSGDISFWKFVQFIFWEQWFSLKKYANDNGIEIIGDMPIYVAFDSVDVWSNTELFDLDSELQMNALAGVPPDAFSDDGQLWGNPVYRWDAHKRSGFGWWISRIESSFRVYNMVRIDHFRGFSSFYAIDSSAADAKNGCWRDGPGYDLFHEVKERLGELPFIAEDLGYRTDELKALLKKCGFPGMKVLEFAFSALDLQNEYLPHNYENNCAAYIGTHDNPPVNGWFPGLPTEEREFLLSYLGCSSPDVRPSLIKLLLHSPASMVIIQLQDYLGLGSESRMNTPSTMSGNWRWRVGADSLSCALAHELRELILSSGR